MNILHLEDEPWDSGIAHYALSLACEQARRGHRVALWGLTGSPVIKEAAARGLETASWQAPPRGWAEIPALRRAAAAFKPAIVNAHTGSAHSLALILTPTEVPLIRTRADARPARVTPLTRWTSRRTTAFIAANSSIKVQLEQAFPHARIELVPEGIAGPEVPFPLPKTPIVGMIARLDPVKGHDVLFDAARDLQSEADLQIFCAGDGSERTRLVSRLAAERLEGLVHLLGRVPDHWAFLAKCRIGVTASVASEAVSRASLEWMAAGRPLIATNVGGLPDIVENGVTGLLVTPGDACALSDALRILFKDPARAEAMGRAGRQHWKEEFSLNPFYRRTQKVYDEAIAALSR